MKPSEQVKVLGLQSLTQVAIDTNESMQNLINWSEKYPRRFELIMKGLMFEKMVNSIEVAFDDISESKRDAQS